MNRRLAFVEPASRRPIFRLGRYFTFPDGPVAWLGVATFEEFSRVFMLNRLWTVWSQLFARWLILLVSACLFGLIHIYQGLNKRGCHRPARIPLRLVLHAFWACLAHDHRPCFVRFISGYSLPGQISKIKEAHACHRDGPRAELARRAYAARSGEVAEVARERAREKL